MKEKNILVKELFHRTKNNMQVISSMLKINVHSTSNEKTKQMLRKLVDKITMMARVHQKLYDEKDLSALNLGNYIEDIISYLYQSYNVSSKKISVEYYFNDISVLFDTALPLGLILEEIVFNGVVSEGISG